MTAKLPHDEMIRRRKARMKRYYRMHREEDLTKKRASYAAKKEDPAYRAARRKYRHKYRGLPEPRYPAPDVCEICHKGPDRETLSLDHDHITGVHRGWLCNACNLGLGCFKDNSDYLVAAAKYLRVRSLI